MKVSKITPGTYPESIDVIEEHKTIYATLVHSRRPAFKIHNGMGQAHSAVNCHRENGKVALYKLVGNAFFLLEIFPDYTCAHCNACQGFYVKDKDLPIWNADKFCNSCALKLGIKLR